MALSLWAGDGSSATGAQPRRMASVVRSDPRTGKLVRNVVVVNPKPVANQADDKARKMAGTSAPSPDPAYGNINKLVAEAAAREALPAALIHSVIKVESNYDANALSTKGAQGLMQLIPETAQRFGVNNAFSPAENIQGGAKYLRYLLELYQGDYVRALAAYNAGEGAVSRYGGVPPYTETRNYLVQVGKQLEESLAGQSQPKPVESQTAPQPAAPGDGVTRLREIVQPDGTVRYVSR